MGSNPTKTASNLLKLLENINKSANQLHCRQPKNNRKLTKKWSNV